MCFRRRQILPFHQELGQVRVRANGVGVQLQREAVRALGLVEIAFFVQDLGEVVVDHAQPGRQLKRPQISGLGVVAAAELAVDVAEIVQRRRGLRLQTDSLLTIVQRFGKTAAFQQQLAEIAVRIR